MLAELASGVQQARAVWASFDYDSWIRAEVARWGREQGWDHVPMRNPDFGFTDYTRQIVQKQRVRGPDQDAITADVLSYLLLPPEQGGSASDWKNGYLRSRLVHPGLTFDDYFRRVVYKKVLTAVNDFYKTEMRAPVSLSPDRSEDEAAGVYQGDVPGRERDPSDLESERERERDRVYQDVYNLLLQQEHGEIKALVHHLFYPAPNGQNLVAAEIVDKLNADGVPTIRGKVGGWTKGAVNGIKQDIQALASEYARMEGLTWRDITGGWRSDGDRAYHRLQKRL